MIKVEGGITAVVTLLVQIPSKSDSQIYCGDSQTSCLKIS